MGLAPGHPLKPRGDAGPLRPLGHTEPLSAVPTALLPRKKSKAGGKAATAPSSQDPGEDSRGPAPQGKPQHEAVLCWLQQGESKEGTTAEGLFWAPEHDCALGSHAVKGLSNSLFMFIIASLECRVPETNPCVK